LPTRPVLPPVMLAQELIITALSSAAEGVKASAGVLTPDGYHPSVKYWRARALKPATVGAAMLVPLMAIVLQLLAVVSPRAETM